MWVNLSDKNRPVTNLDSVTLVSQGRMLCAFADYEAARGLRHRPEDLERKHQEGFIGYKIW
jgi:hypothetical protein